MHGRMITRSLLVVAALAMSFLFAAPAGATLKFYYDPDTGNVSFDTAETRSGGVLQYYFDFNDAHSAPPWEFRPENMIRLSTSSLYMATPTDISDSTQSTPWRGLYTIGDVMPVGLSEETWTTTFVQTANPKAGTYCYGYNDVVGGGRLPAAEFIYGPPEGEFDNKWDLVDPDTLDWATTAKLIYRPRSGEVLIDTRGSTSGYISALLLQSDDQFLPDGFTPFADGPFNSATEDLVSLFADAIEPGRYSLGQILPSGMTSAEFEASLTSAKFLGRAGFSGGSFDFVTHGRAMSLVYAAVPEPSSVVLLGLACLAVLWPLRRRR